MTEYVIIRVTKYILSVPDKEGISSELIPNIIVLGTTKVDYNIIIISFGSYTQVLEKNENIMRIRMVCEIYLGPLNENGSYFFISLVLWMKINCNQWHEFPITEDVAHKCMN